MLRKCPPRHNRVTGHTHFSGRAFRPVLFSWCTPHMYWAKNMVKNNSSDHKPFPPHLSRPFHVGFPLNCQMCICRCDERFIHCNTTINIPLCVAGGRLFLWTAGSSLTLMFSCPNKEPLSISMVHWACTFLTCH